MSAEAGALLSTKAFSAKALAVTAAGALASVLAAVLTAAAAGLAGFAIAALLFAVFFVSLALTAATGRAALIETLAVPLAPTLALVAVPALSFKAFFASSFAEAVFPGLPVLVFSLSEDRAITLFVVALLFAFFAAFLDDDILAYSWLAPLWRRGI
ncbi:hypothetical protein PY365_12625 [Roseiarcaceae bacterium H3SJ34-1]|uniref:hypothetical protein n=1 Tax=Terripilifer ovatus TaxID=3032367 RepID=UPI003AB99731|nr:hypothetical protein [Roseiarcaceae bacterium H3SJ34-1]